jgi:uncharacterized protein
MLPRQKNTNLIVLQPTPYCNIDCSYCYLSDRSNKSLMGFDVVDLVGEKILRRMPTKSGVTLVWHGGEPTAAPLVWHREAFKRLKPHAGDIVFSIQTNAVAIDTAWAVFFRETQMRVGVSIDGPREFHDARRRTRSGRGTFDLTLRGLRTLRSEGVEPSVISVLSPAALDHADDFFTFYREEGVRIVSFNIDEVEAANTTSSFDAARDKPRVTAFLRRLLHLSRDTGYVLHIREIERIGGVLIVDHLGQLSSFSPELVDVRATDYANFRFADIRRGEFEDWSKSVHLQRVAAEITAGVDLCQSLCRYFEVCRGGAPVNKFCETGRFDIAETAFCRLTTQASADALLGFLSDVRTGAAFA